MYFQGLGAFGDLVQCCWFFPSSVSYSLIKGSQILPWIPTAVAKHRAPMHGGRGCNTLDELRNTSQLSRQDFGEEKRMDALGRGLGRGIAGRPSYNS